MILGILYGAWEVEKIETGNNWEPEGETLENWIGPREINLDLF